MGELETKKEFVAAPCEYPTSAQDRKAGYETMIRAQQQNALANLRRKEDRIKIQISITDPNAVNDIVNLKEQLSEVEIKILRAEYDLATDVELPLTEEEKARYAGMHLYEINCTNKGGLLMPVIVEFTFEDGTKMKENIPAQIWRKNENAVSKVFMTTKKAIKIQIDPMRETADINEGNNTWPRVPDDSKFAIFKGRIPGGRGGAQQGINPMQAAQQKK
jgi:hypothetical protein